MSEKTTAQDTDAALAVLLGWHCEVEYSLYEPDKVAYRRWYGPGTYLACLPPAYSTSCEASHELVEAMWARGWDFQSRGQHWRQGTKPLWSGWFYKPESGIQSNVFADNQLEAIALAALSALGTEAKEAGRGEE